MKTISRTFPWFKKPTLSALLITFLTSVYPNLAVSQIEMAPIVDPIGTDKPEPAVFETVLRNGVVVQQRGGPDVAGGEWMYREEKLTTFRAIATLIRMIDADHEALVNLITDLGGDPDIEKLKNSLRNIKFAPMDEVISRNSSGYRELKQVEYDQSANAVVALKQFFAGFPKLIETGEGWDHLPLKLIELLAIESSHSQKLGLTAETTLTQSYNFARYLFNNSLKLIKKSDVYCGKYGDLKTRASDCAWSQKSFVMWPPRRDVWIAQIKYSSSPYTLNIFFDPARQIIYTHISVGGDRDKAPNRDEVLNTCEKLRLTTNIGRQSRLATIEELFRFYPKARAGKDLFLANDMPGLIDLHSKAPAENIKFRTCGFFGCEGGEFGVDATCVFE